MYAQMGLIWVNCICRRNFSFPNQLRNGPGLRWAYMLVLLPQSSDPTRPTTAPNLGFWFLNVDLWVHHMRVYHRVNTDIGPRKHFKKFRNLDLWKKITKMMGNWKKVIWNRSAQIISSLYLWLLVYSSTLSTQLQQNIIIHMSVSVTILWPPAMNYQIICSYN